MNPSQVLIVDDSKTAQHLLKRMLQKYHLKIDVVSSAEEALAYLSYNHPAVIFLDHQMTGMTGMEALKTIKASPHTALIPVVMYTSQQDDLFVSQAIALGAQDILAKGAMQPSNLERVLQVLNISMQAPATTESGDKDKADTSLVAQRTNTSIIAAVKEQPIQDVDKVRLQIGRLFEIHIADVRSQINNSTQFIIKRLSTNIEKSANKEAVIGGASLSAVKSVVKNIISAERKRIAISSNLLLAAITLGIGFLGYALWQVQAELKEASKNLLAAAEIRKTETPPVPASPLNRLMADANSADNASLLRAIGWVQNADFQFNYGEPPLNDLQLANLNRLVNILDDAGYKGPLVVDINFGNVCLEVGDGNTWRLARNDLPATQCKMLKDLNPKFLVTDYLTVPYQNFEKVALPLKDGRISIRLVSSGLNVPHVDYPIIRATTTAGEWNAAALRNNRISIQFLN
ncbi:MAG TPA: response regulator [Burkholderiaceae bacterium]|jgi:CheY-like chemotaxis protein